MHKIREMPGPWLSEQELLEVLTALLLCYPAAIEHETYNEPNARAVNVGPEAILCGSYQTSPPD